MPVPFVRQQFILAIEEDVEEESRRAKLEEIFDTISEATEIEIEALGGPAGIQQLLDEYNS
jgi:hypothetical protein